MSSSSNPYFLYFFIVSTYYRKNQKSSVNICSPQCNMRTESIPKIAQQLRYSGSASSSIVFTACSVDSNTRRYCRSMPIYIIHQPTHFETDWPLSWETCKKTSFTQCCIQETQSIGQRSWLGEDQMQGSKLSFLPGSPTASSKAT